MFLVKSPSPFPFKTFLCSPFPPLKSFLLPTRIPSLLRKSKLHILMLKIDIKYDQGARHLHFKMPAVSVKVSPNSYCLQILAQRSLASWRRFFAGGDCMLGFRTSLNTGWVVPLPSMGFPSPYSHLHTPRVYPRLRGNSLGDSQLSVPPA